MSGARSGDSIDLSLPRARNAATQRDRIESEKPAGRKNAAAVDTEANLDGSTMAPGRGGDHAPISIKLGRNCWRSRANNCGNARQADAARMMSNHESRPFARELGRGQSATARSKQDCLGRKDPLTDDAPVAGPAGETIFVVTHISTVSAFEPRGGSNFCAPFSGRPRLRRRPAKKGPLRDWQTATPTKSRNWLALNLRQAELFGMT